MHIVCIWSSQGQKWAGTRQYEVPADAISVPADSAAAIVKFTILIPRESCTNAKAKYSSSVVPPDPSVRFDHWVQLMPLPSPKPHHLLPHLNPDWFYLSGTGLPRLSWKRGR